MSTVLEAIAARHLGAEVLAISLVTNPAAGLAAAGLDHAEVVAAGQAAAGRMGALLAAGPAPGRHDPGHRSRRPMISGELRRGSGPGSPTIRTPRTAPSCRPARAAARADAAGAEAAAADLADRFAGRLEFGTAGLRGVMAAGPNRMNRAVVRAATAALARWLREHRPAAATPAWCSAATPGTAPAEFADEAARRAGRGGHPACTCCRGRCPRRCSPSRSGTSPPPPGVMITASHNPPADNGYKLYLGDGAQIVPPADAEIEAAIRGAGPAVAGSRWRRLDGPLITQARRRDRRRPTWTRSCAASARRAAARRPRPGRCAWSTPPLHGVAGALMLRAIERAGFPAAVRGAPRRPSRTRTSRTVAFPNPEEPGALDLALADARRLEADLVLANDPDGDRLAVAVPDPAAGGGWRKLTGDQVGALLGAFLLRPRPRPGTARDPAGGPAGGWPRPPWSSSTHAVQDRRGGRSRATRRR